MVWTVATSARSTAPLVAAAIESGSAIAPDESELSARMCAIFAGDSLATRRTAHVAVCRQRSFGSAIRVYWLNFRSAALHEGCDYEERSESDPYGSWRARKRLPSSRVRAKLGWRTKKADFCRWRREAKFARRARQQRRIHLYFSAFAPDFCACAADFCEAFAPDFCACAAEVPCRPLCRKKKQSLEILISTIGFSTSDQASQTAWRG
jgi:hypothetical protein